MRDLFILNQICQICSLNWDLTTHTLMYLTPIHRHNKKYATKFKRMRLFPLTYFFVQILSFYLSAIKSIANIHQILLNIIMWKNQSSGDRDVSRSGILERVLIIHVSLYQYFVTLTFRKNLRPQTNIWRFTPSQTM